MPKLDLRFPSAESLKMLLAQSAASDRSMHVKLCAIVCEDV